MSYMDEKYGPCPICGADAEIVDNHKMYEGEEYTLYLCDNCKYLLIPNNPDILMECNIDSGILAGYLFSSDKKVFLMTPEECERISEDTTIPKKPTDYLNATLKNLYFCGSGNGFLRGISTDYLPLGIGYAKSHLELKEIFANLIDLGFVKIIPSDVRMEQDDGSFKVESEYYCLTAKGLERAEELLSPNSESKNVFIAMKFTNDSAEAKKVRAIKRACNEYGYHAALIKEKEHNDDITDKIISEIKSSRFVIADFTDNNLGVYYEAGFAKGIGLPVIKTCNKDWFDATDENGQRINRLHFDIEHDNLILWKDEKDLYKKLMARIGATIQ